MAGKKQWKSQLQYNKILKILLLSFFLETTQPYVIAGQNYRSLHIELISTGISIGSNLYKHIYEHKLTLISNINNNIRIK